MEYRTQKARGLEALRSNRYKMPAFSVLQELDEKKAGLLVGAFCRPCPVRPRHGFVESRYISNPTEAVELIREVLAADKDGEILIMSKIDAQFSAVHAGGILAIGRGNDGATAGKCAVNVPTIGELVTAHTKKAAGITEEPFVEMVYGWNAYANCPIPYFVQLRNGPKISGQSVDFIPKEYTVKNVYHADGDLLVWEKLIQEAKEGDVVYHPNGSLASHYAVHAVAAGIPVLISREPAIGEVLKPEAGQEQKEVDVRRVRAGFRYAMVDEIANNHENYAYAAKMMLAALHHSAVWGGKLDEVIGYGMGMAWRLTVIAGLGEYRHEASMRRDGKGKNKKSIARESVYSRMWKSTHRPYGKNRFCQALSSFGQGPKVWPSSYGGLSWYRACCHALTMYNALGQGDYKTALFALNQLVHSAHNGGWLFDKFANKRVFDEAAENPVRTLVEVAPSVYRVVDAFQKNVNLLDALGRKWKVRPIPEPAPEYKETVKKPSAKSLELLSGDSSIDDDDDSDSDADDNYYTPPAPKNLYAMDLHGNYITYLNLYQGAPHAEEEQKKALKQAHGKKITHMQFCVQKGAAGVIRIHVQYKVEGMDYYFIWEQNGTEKFLSEYNALLEDETHRHLVYSFVADDKISDEDKKANLHLHKKKYVPMKKIQETGGLIVWQSDLPNSPKKFTFGQKFHSLAHYTLYDMGGKL